MDRQYIQWVITRLSCSLDVNADKGKDILGMDADEDKDMPCSGSKEGGFCLLML